MDFILEDLCSHNEIDLGGRANGRDGAVLVYNIQAPFHHPEKDPVKGWAVTLQPTIPWTLPRHCACCPDQSYAGHSAVASLINPILRVGTIEYQEKQKEKRCTRSLNVTALIGTKG